MGYLFLRGSTETSSDIWRRSKPIKAAWWSFVTRCDDRAGHLTNASSDRGRCIAGRYLNKNSQSATYLSPDNAVAPVIADTAGRNRLVINLLLVATFVVILNETLMAVAIPRLMRDLNVTAGAVQWLTTAFLFTVSVVIPVTGFFLQRMNTRPIFLLAMLLFTLGTLVAPLASNLQLLILAP